ncbi:hypothetical protein NN561_000471 [Cricetulus griseus]
MGSDSVSSQSRSSRDGPCRLGTGYWRIAWSCPPFIVHQSQSLFTPGFLVQGKRPEILWIRNRKLTGTGPGCSVRKRKYVAVQWGSVSEAAGLPL